MPKTRDAFALREIYEARVDFRALLVVLGAEFVDRRPGEEADGGEIKPQKMAAAFKRVERLIRLIKNHRRRLQEYSNIILDRLVDNDGDEGAILKARRARQLRDNYYHLYRVLDVCRDTMERAIQRSVETMIDAFRREFGARLRQARKAKKMTATEVAKKLGMSHAGYLLYEYGKRDPSPWTILTLSTLLGVSLDWLFGNK